MADDWEDIGSFDVFPFTPNWARRIDRNFELARILMKHTGSASYMVSVTDDVPEKLKIGVTIASKSDEYDLIDFHVNHRGRLNKFWMRAPVREFTLKEDALSGSGAIITYVNGAHLQYQGYERIYIVMNNGDILSRKVGNITYDDVNEKYTLTLTTNLDRDLETDNHFLIARLLLGRFDEDSLILDYETDGVSEQVLTFQELVKEYSEIV